MKSAPSMRSVVPVALALYISSLIIVACHARQGDEDAYLFKIGDEGVSVAAFRHALELEQPNALSEQGGGDVETILTFLNQMIEERLLLARGAELGIVIDEEALEAAIDAVRADYPDDTFEETLLENAVSFNQWREQLRRRLLLEKVVNQELEEKVEISPEDVAAYYAQHYANRTQAGEGEPLAAEKPLAAESIHTAIVNQLRRSKAQERYPAWIHGLQTRYGVTVDWDRWHQLTENLHAASPQGAGAGMRLVSPPATP
jgi:parvulin-like peptidyl-prolyl isomerase